MRGASGVVSGADPPVLWLIRTTMAMGDKSKHAAEEAGGKVREATGKATGKPDSEAEGRGDQASAKVKQAVDKAKHAVGEALDR